MSPELDPDERFTVRMYAHFRRVWLGTYEQRKKRTQQQRGDSEPFGKGREPRPLADTLAVMSTDLGWTQLLAETSITQNWSDLVGSSMAEHARVLEVSEGVIRVQCDSTAWATELRRMRTQVITRIQQEYPDAHIEEIKFIAPNAPSWKHGPKSIPGRGPRDTYG